MSAQSASQERAAFEAWQSDSGRWPKSVERDGEGYKLAQTHTAWVAWQGAWKVARAAPQKAAVPASPPVFSGYLKVVGMPDTERRLQWDEPATPQGAEPVAAVVAPAHAKTLAERCKLATDCLPMAEYRSRLEALHAELLDAAQAPANTSADHIRRLAEDYADACVRAGYVTTVHSLAWQKMVDAINALAAPQALSVGAATFEFAGWQQRYIDPEEGPSIWIACDDTSSRILAKRSDHELRAVYALAASPPPAAPAAPAAVPEGWKLVPVKATQAMLDECKYRVDEPGDEGALLNWNGMLAAAPSHPAEQREGEPR